MKVFKNHIDFHREIDLKEGSFSIKNKIDVRHCRFEEGLRLFNGTEFLAPVIFRDCEFLQDELFMSTSFKDILIIDNCVFHGTLQIIGSTFYKRVNLERCIINGKFTLHDSVFHSYTSLFPTYFQGGSNLFGTKEKQYAGSATFHRGLNY